jgi:broad specificity phosphatase PhoE
MLIAFIRHASTVWNAEERMQGRRDIPLSSAGRADVARWRMPAAVGAPIEWLTSPLTRAVETATALCGKSPRCEPALIEMDWGRWEGQRLDELRARAGAAFLRNERRGLDFRPPGGESPRDVIVRVNAWLDAIAARDAPIVAVTHNGVLRALLAMATGWDMTGKPPVKLRPATLHRFVLSGNGSLAVDECNVPLVPGISAARAAALPPVPSATPP